MKDRRKKQVVLTLKRFYFKEVEIVVDDELIKGKTDEEISDFLIEDYPYEEEEELFKNSELEELEINSNGAINEDTDRFDIYEDNEQTYGGHL